MKKYSGFTQTPTFKKFKSGAGFSLIEIILTIAIIALISGFSIPVYRSFHISNNLDIASNTIAQILRRAQILSQGVTNDSSWGIYLNNNNLTLFQGSSYLSRSSEFDENTELPSGINSSEIEEIVFERLTGFLPANTTINLNSFNNEARIITINKKGVVNY